MRPVFYEFPDALRFACDQSTTFMLGDRLLIAPPPNLESSKAYDVCLPAGRWYDYWSGREVLLPPGAGTANVGATANQWLKATPALEVLPVFVRAGAILPRQPLVQSTAEPPNGPLSLDVYSGDDCRGTLYADDGHSMAYRQRGYLRQAVSCALMAEGLTVDFEPRDGDYRPWWQTIEIVVHGWRGEGHAQLGNLPLATHVDAVAQTLQVMVADQPHAARLILRH
jgi:alpha-glucosidase